MYERVGGEEFFVDLITRFYERVAADPLLRPLYPDELTASKTHLALFLAQYWGGPRDYDELRGHPRLRMRHTPFAIGLAERDAWLGHMNEALSAADGLDAADAAELRDYFEMAATQLVNTV